MSNLLTYLKRFFGNSQPASSAVPNFSEAGSEVEQAVQYPGVFGRIHKNDTMIGGTSTEMLKVYNRIGDGAYRLILHGLSLTNRQPEDIQSLLDFGCGYGRVNRVLAQNFDPQKISVFDIDQTAASFCAKEFGVKAIKFNQNWDWHEAPFETYDLIWVGSVFTHLSKPHTNEMLGFLATLLQENGVLIFTTHGEEAIQRLASGFFGEQFQAYLAEVRDNYDKTGFHFIPYQQPDLDILPFEHKKQQDFGMTWMSEAYVRKIMADITGGDLRLLEFKPKGWEGVQDAFFFERVKVSNR